MGEEIYFAFLHGIKRNKIISGLILAVLGLMFLVLPFASMVTVCRTAGWIVLIGGLMQIAASVSGLPGRRLRNPYLYLGIITAFVGFAIVGNPYMILDWINLIFGVAVVISSAICLLHDQQMRRYIDTSGGLSVILSVAGIILGVLIILNPFGTVVLLSRMIGIVLCYEAFVNFRVFSIMRTFK